MARLRAEPVKRSGKRKGHWTQYAGIAACAFVLAYVSNASAQDALTRAGDAVEAFRNARAELVAAQQAGDAQRAQEIQGTLQTHLADAREAFETGDVLARGDRYDLRDYAEVLSVLGHFDLAAEALRTAVEKSPESAELRNELAKALAKVGDEAAQEAVTVLREVLDLTSDAQETRAARNTLGQIYLDQGLYDFALESFEESLSIEPQDAFATAGVAILEIRDGNILQASQRLETAGGVPGGLTPSLQQSLDDFKRGGRMVPDKTEHHIAYARLHTLTNQWPETVLPLKRALVLEPKNTEALNLLAASYRFLGNPTGAKALLEQSLAIEPNQPEIQRSLETMGQN